MYGYLYDYHFPSQAFSHQECDVSYICQKGQLNIYNQDLAQILINKYGVPIVDDQDTVEEVLGKKVKWLGNIPGDDSYGWYERSIGGDPHAKILVGRPKVKTGK